MHKSLTLSIKTLLFAVTMIVALPCVGIIIYSGFQLRNNAIDIAGKETQKVVELVVSEQQNLTAATEQLMTTLARIPEVIRRDTGDVQTILISLLQLNPQYANILISDNSGNVWCSGVPANLPISIADRSHFRNALSSGRFTSSEYIISRTANKPSINYAYPYRDQYGKIAGVIVVAINLDYYKKITEQFKLPPNTGLLLTDHKGIIIFSSLNSSAAVGMPLRQDLYLQMAEGPEKYTGIIHSMANDERIISYRKLRLRGESAPYLYVRMGISYDETLSAANRMFFNNVALLSSFLLMAVSVAIMVSKYFIIQPISLLADASRRLANGEQHILVAKFVKGGELRTLGQAFDHMAEQLERRERSLRDSEGQLRALFEASQSGIVLLDTTGEIKMANKRMAEMFSCRLGDLVDSLYTELVHPDQRRVWDEEFRKITAKEIDHISTERYYLRGDGSSFWGYFSGRRREDEDGKLIGLVGHITDISEIKHAEEELQEYLLFIETLLKNAPVGIRVFEGASGTCLLANQITADIAGSDIETMQRQNFRELVSWRTSGLLEVAEEVLTDGCARRVESDMLTTFGKQVSVEYIVSSFVVKGKPHILIIGRDITVEKQLVDKNKKIEAQMLHVQKLESLGVLAGGIAHDFNNILMAILGNAELALMRLAPESPVYNNLQQIEKAAHRAADLAQQMLAYSGKGQFVVERLDINALITEMNHILEVSISKKAVMHLRLAKDLPVFEGDATQFRQIIMNLVINASESIGDENGVIAITTGTMDCDQTYLSKIWLYDKLAAGTYIYLEITDTGCGMDRDTISKIFDPFFTTKFTGRGLGLAAVLGIIRGHRGAINLYSEPGKGTSFKVYLPAKQNITSISTQEFTPIKPCMGSGTLLLVDNEETILTLGKDMLEDLGYRVLTAENGVVALEVFKGHKEEIVCVILDLSMPRLNGEQTFRELQRIDQNVQVILSSGYNELETTRNFVGTGLAGFIQKPYNLVELSRKLQGILVERQIHEQSASVKPTG